MTRRISRWHLIIGILAIILLFAAWALAASDKDFLVTDGEPFTKKDIIGDQLINQPFNLYIYVTNPGHAQETPPSSPITVTVFLVEEGYQNNKISLGTVVIPTGGHGILAGVTYGKTGRVHIEVAGNLGQGVQTSVSNTFNVTAPTGPAAFYLEGFKDSALTQPLNAPTAGTISPVLAAGETFYIKATAKNANGSTYTGTYYSTQGKQNVTGTIYALDALGGQYGPDKFSTSGQLTDVPGSPGVGVIQAVFNDVGIIHLSFVNSLQVQSSSGFVGRFIPHHFTVVPLQGGYPSVVSVKWRASQGAGAAGSTWGYIGEQMEVKVTLEARNKNDILTPGYTGEFAKFVNSQSSGGVPGWNMALSAGGNDYTARISSFASSSGFSGGVGTAVATFSLAKDPGWQSREQVNNLTVSINPTDADGIRLANPVNAVVLYGATQVPGPYNLYGGRVRVLGGYFNQPTVNVPGVVERWNGQKFVTNTWDSVTTLAQGAMLEAGGPPNVLAINSASAFASGQGNISVTNNGGSNITRTLADSPGVFPQYLDFLSGTLAWGQIVEPGGPPPGDNGRIIWEKEVP